MMPFEGRGPGPSLQDAETLVGSLVGVAGVRVRASDDGTLREIIVVPDHGASDRQISRNIVSALMARFGWDLDPSAISIAPAGADTSGAAADSATDPAMGPAKAQEPIPRARASTHSGPEPISNGKDALVGDRNGTAHVTGERTNGTNGVHPTTPADPAASVPTTRRRIVAVEGSARPRLELVELQRAGGVVRCRVVIAIANERFTGVADVVETRVADIDVAARVTIDALRAARTPRQPIQFEGASLIDVAGRAHVVTSLSLWTGHDFEPIAGAEPIYASPVEAAAQAVISSITARLIT